MKSLLIFQFLTIGFICFSQHYYKPIKMKNTNSERLDVAKNFILDYINKCEKKDYTKFQNYIIDKRASQKLNDSVKENCNRFESLYGSVELSDLNSSYYHKYAKNYDPLELFVFNFKTEKKPDIKYASVWVYEDQNVIGGIWFSTEKPLKKRAIKTKQSSK